MNRYKIFEDVVFYVVECVIFLPSGPGGIPPRGLLGDGPNDPRGGTLLSVTGEVIDPK